MNFSKCNISLFVGLSLFIFSGCEKEIPFTDEEAEPRLVVNSFFSKDSVWMINLSESRSVLTNELLPFVESATIKLSDQDGNNLGDFTYADHGNFRLESPLPLLNNTYHLSVSAPNLPPVNATSSIPSDFSSIEIDTTFSEDDYTMIFDVKFKDDLGKKNYYGISIRSGDYWIEGEDTIYQNSQRFYTYEPFVENGEREFDSNEKYASIFYFTDELFESETIEFSGMTRYINPNYSPGYYRVVLYHFSEEAYKYSLSLAKYKASNGNIFAEPVQIISNIENGFGVFGGQVCYERIMIIE